VLAILQAALSGLRISTRPGYSPGPTEDSTVKLRLHVLVSVLVWSFCVGITSAQNGGAIRGVVRDPEGNPLPRATVELARGSAVVRTQTSPTGEYVFASLRPGTYTISIPPDGFTLAPFQQEGVQVAAGQTIRVDARLQWGGNLGTLGDDQSRFYLRLSDPPIGPVPRTRRGKPDLSGVWIGTHFQHDPAADAMPLPWAEALVKERIANDVKDHPNAFCLPGAVIPGGPLIFQIVQHESSAVWLFENVPNYRQVYLDGRQHPKDLNPSWTGHSIGRWDGNTLVIDTVGFNDKSWIEIFPHTDKLHVIERYTRIDRGRLNIEVLIEDPGTFVRPWRSRATWTLAPDHEVYEYVCAENNKQQR